MLLTLAVEVSLMFIATGLPHVWSPLPLGCMLRIKNRKTGGMVRRTKGYNALGGAATHVLRLEQSMPPTVCKACRLMNNYVIFIYLF